MTHYNFEWEEGFKFKWEKGYRIKILPQGSSVYIQANAAGLESLANHLHLLANSKFSNHYHFHLDDCNCLETGSLEIIIEKNEDL